MPSTSSTTPLSRLDIFFHRIVTMRVRPQQMVKARFSDVRVLGEHHHDEKDAEPPDLHELRDLHELSDLH